MLFTYDHPFKRWGFWIREKYVTNDYVELIYVEDYKTVGSHLVSKGEPGRSD